jgi:hypothetical protein
VIGIILDGSREKCVDEGCLSKTRFASNLFDLVLLDIMGTNNTNHDCESSTALCNNLVSTIKVSKSRPISLYSIIIPLVWELQTLLAAV